MLVAVGLNQRAAPVAERESLTIEADDLDAVLGACASLDGVDEVAAVSTCYRVELYAAASCPAAATLSLRRALEARARRALGLLELRGGDAFRHLARVAAGLESAVLGEPAIHRKVDDAFRRAVEVGAAGPELAAVGAEASRIAARVRSETPLTPETGSWGNAVAALADKVIGPLAGRDAAVVGDGELARLVARSLAAQGARVGTAAASAADARALDAALRTADVAVLTARVPEGLAPERVAALVRERRRRLVVVDLAVPRAVPEAVGRLDDVYLCDVDDLDRVIRATQDEASDAVAQAERIVDEEVRRWGAEHDPRTAAPSGRGPDAGLLAERAARADHAEARRARPA